MATTTLPPRKAAEFRAKAQATRALLDDTAALVNGAYATALRIVIDAFEHQVHRDADGFSAQRDWLISNFDFTLSTSGEIAAIAKYAKKFTRLAEAGLSGHARIDQVAFAVRSLAKTTAAALFARTPFRSPVRSPFDPETWCETPEVLVAEYCAHAPFKVLRRHLAELHANLAGEAELLDSLGEESLQRFEVQELAESGMWVVAGLLSATTGALLDKYLKTAVSPPRQDETDADGVLPPAATRNAEALHQLVAGYGASPEAATRHGHTATLDLVVDIETLQGKDTGRVPTLEGRPVSLAWARFLACETRVIPGVFDYATGEAVELGRALRLPNVALRRKLELEQPGGCAWEGCGRPVSWCEAHHLQHWVDGGPTDAENLILLCRFHHGRIHTVNWTVTKTGPGRAHIVHHDHPYDHSARADACESRAETETGVARDGEDTCGCSDWRTDTDMDTLFEGDPKNLFPTGLYPTEWSEAMRLDLEAIAEQAKAARLYFELGGSAAEFEPRGLADSRRDEVVSDARNLRGPVTDPPRIYGDRASSQDLIPFLAGLPGLPNPAGKTAARHGPERTLRVLTACCSGGLRGRSGRGLRGWGYSGKVAFAGGAHYEARQGKAKKQGEVK